MLTTAEECYRYTLEGIKKANAGTLSRPEFTTRYNGAQLSLVRSAYEKTDKDQKTVDFLRQLTPAPLVIANSGVAASEQEVFLLPYVAAPPAGMSHGYLHTLSVGLKVASFQGGQQVIYTCTSGSGYLSAKIMARDRRYSDERNPFKRPKPERPYVYFVEDRFTARCGAGYFALEARLEYVRYPIAIDADQNTPVNPELNAAVNQSVCDLVIRQYLEAVQSQRAQTIVPHNPLHT